MKNENDTYSKRNSSFNQSHYTSLKKQVKRKRFNEMSRPNYQPKLERTERDPYEEMLATASAITAKVIRTLESNGFTFSATDLEDMRQAAQLALVEIGFYESGTVDGNTFKAIARAIEGRECMRLNCRWESTHEKFNVLEEMGVFHEFQRGETCQSMKQESTRSALCACWHALRMSCKLSTSRSKRMEYKGHKQFLQQALASTGAIKGDALPPLNPATYRKRKQRFLSYLQAGAQAMHESGKNSDVASDILRNLEMNFAKA
jgi:hypothetical protein